MAIQPFVQVVWGRPKVRVEASEGQVKGVPYLQFEMFNEPIEKGPLSWLHVERDTAKEIWANIEILEDGTNRLISSMLLVDLGRGGTGEPKAQRIPLPPSAFGAKAMVVFRSLETGGVVMVENVDGEFATYPITAGRYIATITVEGLRESCGLRRHFQVTRDNSFFWL